MSLTGYALFTRGISRMRAERSSPKNNKMSLRHARAYREIILLAFLFISIIPIAEASAHSLDMYAQSQAIQITQAGIQVDWKITPGPILGADIWGQANQNQDGQISQAEAVSWLQSFLSGWTLSMDGETSQTAQVLSVAWPSSPDQLQSGEQPIEIHLAVNWPGELDGILSGSHSIEIHNAYMEAISLNAYSLSSQSGISFSKPSQSNGLLQLIVFFTASPDNTEAITAWDSGKPDLSAMTGTLTGLAGNLAGSSSTQTPASNQTGVATALAGLVRTQNFSPLFLLGAFLLSLALGSLHALTPGHGKTLVAAYLVGSHGRTRDAVFLGSIVTITHTGSVLIFGLFNSAGFPVYFSIPGRTLVGDHLRVVGRRVWDQPIHHEDSPLAGSTAPPGSPRACPRENK